MDKSIKRNVLMLLVIASALVFSGCSESETRVVIFHTNDTHSILANFPELAYLVEKERETTKHVLLVSGGDIFSGNAIVDYYDPRGFPKIDIMNRLGYDVNTIGNHDFDYGPEILQDRIDQSDFPFILANIRTGNTPLAQPEPYLIAGPGRLKIAFLGLIQLNDSGIPSTHPDKVKGMEFFPAIETASDFSYLADKADAVIALTHLGFAADTLLAWENPWLNIIIGGHSHTLITEPRKYNDVLVTQSGSRMRYVGKLTLLFRNRELIEIKPEVISLESVEGRNMEIASLVEEYNNNPALNRVIGRLAYAIEGKPDLCAFVTDAFREFGNFDLAFQNYGGIRVNRLEGEIRVRDVFEMDPFGNQLVSIHLNYSELKDLLGNNLSPQQAPTLQISGGIIEIHIGNEGEPELLRIFDSENNELEHGRKYLTAMPSYVASAYNFEREDPGSDLGIITTEILINYIEGNYEINYSPSERLRVIYGKDSK
jgi:5'-nucleotidase / UDP-sugar diphosphatase